MVDEAEGVATFYIWTPAGALAGFQQYRPGAEKSRKNDPRESRYFTYRTKSVVSVWGVESLHLSPGLLFVTEGLFDACRLTARGASAVATIANDPNWDLRNLLQMLPGHKVVVADNDKAGRKLHKVGDSVEVVPTGKDLGDAPEEYVSELLARYL